MINLTQKERTLLEDQKKHEQICIQKYISYANQATSPELQQLFQNYAQQEQSHYDSINQILSGQIPNLQNQNQQNIVTNQEQMQLISDNKLGVDIDAQLCNDLLMTEKYVSGTYDTTIFEFTNSEIRQILNHIQKEEQQHGEGIFNYMLNNGMYKPQ